MMEGALWWVWWWTVVDGGGRGGLGERGGDGWGGRGPKIPKISPPMFRTKIVHTSGKMFDFLGVDFRFGGTKNIFNLCSHIELNTQNPNPILKFTISFTKTPTKPKHFRTFVFLWKIPKTQIFQKLIFLFGSMYTFHNSYFTFYFFILENSKNRTFPKTQNFIWYYVYVP